MPRIGLFGLSRRTKYKLELNHVIRVAVNKHVFGKPNSPTFASPRRAHRKTRQDETKLGRTEDKESSYLWKQLLFIQIHLWREK